MDPTVIGIALSKAIAKLVFRRESTADAISDNVLDIIGGAVSGLKSQRSWARQIEAIGDRISDELEPYFDVEYGGLAANERAAAGYALTRSLERVQLSRSTLVEVDGDPRKLEALLWTEIDTSDLSASADAFLATLVTETCVYMTAAATALPGFAADAAVEGLRRDREIAEAIERAIREIPKEVIAALSEGDPRRFELDYRRQVVAGLDRLSLIGLGSMTRSYPLTIAYYTLKASWYEGGLAREREVHELLASRRRLVIRGEAGSGKTTLLRWLAVRAAQRSFTGPLAEWNGLVPLYVPLRRFARDANLPAVGRFAEYGAGPISGSIPPGWTHTLLSSGRALVLIDGLDEIPAHLLEELNAWIASLMVHYPNCVYVVTSRPSALAGVSLIGDEFHESVLEPMDEADVSTFVEHWHKAARHEVTDEDAAADFHLVLGRLREALETNRDLRALARTPLLCALVCALAHERYADVPRHRLGLYASALEVLVFKRELKREVGDKPPFTYDEALALLQDLAYWMLRHHEITARYDELVARIDSRLQSMPKVQSTSSDIATYLINRSGLLRQPSAEEVDFIHVTFRDYLAARAIVENDDIRPLLREARENRWQDVTVFAAGLSNETQRRRIFQGLLFDQQTDTRWGGSRVIRHVERTGHEFVALACLEVCTSVAPEVDQQIRGRIADLVPPRSAQDARLIAAGGDAAIRALSTLGHALDSDAAMRTVQALAATGLPSALPPLAEWARDERADVKAAVAAAWSSCDPESFAREVLTQFEAVAEPPALTLSTVQLPYVGCLTWVRDVRLVLPPPEQPLGQLPVAALARLEIDGFAGSSLRGLEQAQDLRALHVSSAARLQRTPELPRLSKLESLALGGLPAWDDGDGLSALANLASLELTETGSVRRVVLDGRALRRLVVTGCVRLERVDISSLERLDEVALRNTPLADIAWISQCSALRTLELRGLDVTDPPALDQVASLSELAVVNCRNVGGLTWLTGVPNLTKLSLAGCWRLRDLAPLSELRNLEILDLSFCSGLTDLSPLEGLDLLKHVDLTGCSIGLQAGALSHVLDVEFPYPA